jgi:hypothetical protein
LVLFQRTASWLVGRQLLRAVVLSLLGVLACTAAPATAATVPPSDYYGANIQPLFEASFVPAIDWNGLFATMATDELQTARMDAVWAWVEPNPPVNGQHTYTWDTPSDPAHSLDQIVGALASHGIRMVAVLDLPPSWAGSRSAQMVPGFYDDYVAFAAAFAARYGEGGTFWQQNPQLPYLPVQEFEIWNEANSANFWSGSADPTEYMKVLVPASAAIHAVDPSAKVLASIGWQNLQSYVSELYTLGIKGSIQGIAFHPYAPDAYGIVLLTEELRSTLQNSGDPSLPIYEDEVGLPDAASGPGAAFAYDGPVSDAARAATLSLTGDALAHGDCGVQSYDVFSLVGSDNNATGGGGYFGMFNYATDAPNATGTAIVAASERWRASPAGGLVECGSGTTPTADLLPLGLALTHTSPTCVSAEITYGGNPLENAELVLRTADGRVDPAGTNAFGQTQMCLQNGPPIKSFTAYAEVSSPATAASLTAPNMAWSATYTCPLTTAVCTEDSAPPTGTGAAATGTYRLNAALVKVSRKRATLRARLVSTAGKPPAVRLQVWLPRHGKTARKLITTVTLTAARWRTFTSRVALRVGGHLTVSVVADKRVGLTALHTTLVATRKLGARR